MPSRYAWCETCFVRMHGNRKRDCARCRAWRLYWESLTPAEQAEEIRAMDRYADEQIG